MSVEDCDSMFYYVVDKDTGKKIDNCMWADDVSGEYEVACLGAEGNVIIDRDEGIVRTEKKVGNILLVDTRVDTRNEKDALVI
jgi:hypothetical protein